MRSSFVPLVIERLSTAAAGATGATGTGNRVKPFIEGTSDFAFKKLFHSKEVLIPVLNDAFELEGEREINDLEFGDPHHPGVPEKSKSTTFDLYCRTSAGERIIIEMQRVSQLYFYKRALYDWALEVTQQDKPQSDKDIIVQRHSKNFRKGQLISKRVAWDYNFEPVYQFSVCDFPVFADDLQLKTAPLLRGMIHFNGNKPVHNYLAPLRLCFMQLPNFTLTNPRTSSPAEKIGTILTTLHKLNSLDELPEALRHDPLVERAAELLSRAKLSREEVADYEYSLKHARDEYAVQKTIEAKERANEEMKRANEEMKRANEEMKRANEEMKRANEEKDRANEEMKRANEEMKRANEEKDRANEEMKRANEEMKRAIEGMKRDLVEQEKPKTG